MTFQTYIQQFEQILNEPNPTAPYDNADYLNYTKLNWSRMNRWLKKGEILPHVKEKIQSIQEAQQWIVITEPWCGDASHIVPFIHMMAELNPLIHIDFELRDAEPNRIQDYLTNGGKAIPKLIIKNANGDRMSPIASAMAQDLAVWGPRPAECQVLYQDMHSNQAPFEEVKIKLQNWYNEHRGVEIQEEIAGLL
ncbi:thioredoxin family protein [Fluviicola taffensis]|uniref:Thioredoxin family protein n=1 Tax=Fluviicola taffensis (strain DSM 16823 / NCIMB 13979 / RW262) TaxID=755732 RepID=F2IHY9_FLUTR|nr:thioredoxin family protein [Fluviicola taffensis]AEA45948.1 hypothetical protein Fluta_3985 [Fluviicola taffensis DSM 16823]